jgi:hypothetical protein
VVHASSSGNLRFDRVRPLHHTALS